MFLYVPLCYARICRQFCKARSNMPVHPILGHSSPHIVGKPRTRDARSTLHVSVGINWLAKIVYQEFLRTVEFDLDKRPDK